MMIPAALIIGFDQNEYFVKEEDGNVTLTVRTSGTMCNDAEWMIGLNTKDASAQCISSYTM